MIINGFAGLTETGRRGVMDPKTGVTTEVRYSGPTEAVKAAVTSMVGSVYYVEYDYTNPPVGTLVVRSPDWGDNDTSIQIQTTYDLVANLVQKSGYEHPTSIAIGPDGDNGLTAIAAKVGQEGALATDFTGNSRTLFEMMTAGQDTFFQSQFVFKYSRFASRHIEVDIAYAGFGGLYGTGDVIDETGAPPIYQNALWEAHAAVWDYYGSEPDGHTIGWLKHAPQLNGASGNKNVITVEWYLDAWRDYYYP
jgi:hypothetical protein